MVSFDPIYCSQVGLGGPIVFVKPKKKKLLNKIYENMKIPFSPSYFSSLIHSVNNHSSLLPSEPLSNSIHICSEVEDLISIYSGDLFYVVIRLMTQMLIKEIHASEGHLKTSQLKFGKLSKIWELKVNRTKSYLKVSLWRREIGRDLKISWWQLLGFHEFYYIQCKRVQ